MVAETDLYWFLA